MKRIAVFASGEGTNAERLIRYFNQPGREATVSLVVSSRVNAPVVERANALGVEVAVPSREDFADGAAILHTLVEHGIDAVVLAGFLLMVPECVIRAYRDRIFNIHPALLPKFGGKGMYGMRVHEAVVAAGESESGITIHHVNDHYDDGTIVFQVSIPIAPEDMPVDVARKVRDLELEHFAPVVERLLK